MKVSQQDSLISGKSLIKTIKLLGDGKMKYQLVDKQTKEISTPHYIGLAPNGELYCDGMNVTDRYIIRRFTGFLDNKGIEIYEGDILQPRNNEKKFYTIVWHDGGFSRKYRFIRNYKGKEWEETSYVPVHPKEFNVVGNIYEQDEPINLPRT